MNRVYRIIWSKALGTWVVASEFATRSGKGGGGADVDERGEAAAPSRHPGLGWQMRICAAAVMLALYLPAQAADWYWDADATGTSSGGTGTWNTTLNLWSDNPSPTLGPYRAWNNAAIDNAIFGGTAGTVTLGVPIVANRLTFNVSGYTLTGGQLTLAGPTPTIDGAGNATISSVLGGSAGLTKAGTGALTLTGANTFTGAVNINAGSLVTGSNAALGNAANIVNLANGARLSSSSSLAGRTVNLTGAEGYVRDAGAGAAHFTGTGGLGIENGASLTDDTNDFTGVARFAVDGAASFSSVRNAGEASSLGAGSGANATIRYTAFNSFFDTVTYTGDGDTSNRSWIFDTAGTVSSAQWFTNGGTGTLNITGDISASDAAIPVIFSAATADLGLLGTISGTSNRTFLFGGSNVGRTITLGGANTYGGVTTIGYSGALTVRASTLADAGVNSSFGTGAAGGITIASGAVLSYTGDGDSSNRAWTIGGSTAGLGANGSILNDGTGALALTGTVAFDPIANNSLTLGGLYTGASNTISGVISGIGNLVSNGAGTWTLSGANTHTGAITVNGGTLRAGNASAFGTTTGVTVNGGTLDLNGNSMTTSALSGTGGTVALGSGNLTVNSTTNTTYSGSITGSGGLTKLGATSTLTLKGANTYTGATTIGGGTLALDFTGAGGPANNIVSSGSTLNMAGGTLAITGATGETNSQTFNGMQVTSGNNTLRATSTGAGNLTVNLGTITQSGGILSFVLPTAGGITTTNADGALGGWATINGTDYAQVVGGRITALTTYANKDNAATWLTGDILSDEANAANTPYFGTVASNVQLGGLKYTAAANSTVTVGAANTLGVNGTIIVAPSVGNNRALTITGGSMTGGAGGGALGVQQNGGTGTNFTIASTIINNPANAPGQGTNFVKSGTGLVTLTGSNTYTGSTTVSGGTLSVGSIANGGVASGIGASTADASNLMVQGATLRYTGGTTTTDRGFTLGRNGPVTAGTIEVTQGATDLRFDGQVVSTDGAGLTKTGAGRLILSNGNNNYTGVTTVSGGTLSVDDLADGGQASGIGASSAASSNLVLENGGELEYTGGTVDIDRGFTLGTGGGAVDVTQGTTTLAVEGDVVGTGTLTKNGPGTLLLSGTNTFNAGGAINGGVLQAGSDTAFGTGGWTIASGSTLDLNDFDNTVRELVGPGTVDLGSATLTINNGRGFDFTGNITGTGAVTIYDGSQRFSGCGNSYLGATTIQSATLTVDCLRDGGLASGIGASGAGSSNLVLVNGALLNYTGGNVSIDRGFTLDGSVSSIGVVQGATTLEFRGAAVGASALNKTGDGTLLLSGNNTYSGGTRVIAGTLLAGRATNAFGTGFLSVDNVAGARVDLNGFDTTVLALYGGGALGGNIDLGAQTLTITNGSNATYAGAISGTGGLVKDGGAAQVLSGCNNSYTGSTVIEGGYIFADCLRDGGTNSSIGASTADASNLVINNGGILRYTGAGDSTNRQLTLGEAGNGYIEAFGTGTINFTSTAPIEMTGTGNHTLRLGGDNTGNNTLAAQIDDPGTGTTGLLKYHAGTWVLSNTGSTYTRVTDINEGVLAVTKLADGGQASSIGSSANTADKLIVRNLATLRYIGTGDSTDRLMTLVSGNVFLESSGTGAIRFTNQGAVTLFGNATHVVTFGGTYAGNNLFAGRFADVGAFQTSIAKNGPGTWILTGNSTHTGNTVINDGNLVIGDGGNSGNLGTGNVIVDQATSTLSINRNDIFNFASTISGPGALAQIGTGTTVLTSTGNSIGAARVSNGTLQVNGGLDTSNIAMTNTSGLTVNGTVQAAGGTTSAITGDAGASTITVGAAGTLRAAGDLGGGSDTLTLTGTLTTGAGALNLGAGDDTLTINQGATVGAANVNGGAGTNDVLQVNNASALTLGVTNVSGFESLAKQLAGTLTLTGNQSFATSVQVGGGTLTVGTDNTSSLTTAALTMGRRYDAQRQRHGAERGRHDRRADRQRRRQHDQPGHRRRATGRW
jgi:fibronectin-binding autotransporter adhesin